MEPCEILAIRRKYIRLYTPEAIDMKILLAELAGKQAVIDSYKSGELKPMSKTKESLEVAASKLGLSASQYLAQLKKDRELQRDYEEFVFWRDVHSGKYFEEGYNERSNG